MTIAAHENGEPLRTDTIRKFQKEHPRCGTAFLLVVMVVAIITFVFLGRPDFWLRVVSRIVLVPAIAAMLGPRLWWPRRRAPRPTVGPVTTVATR